MELDVIAAIGALVPDFQQLLGERTVLVAIHGCLIVLAPGDQDHGRLDLRGGAVTASALQTLVDTISGTCKASAGWRLLF